VGQSWVEKVEKASIGKQVGSNVVLDDMGCEELLVESLK
jgi:hypothetical protein